MSYDFSFPLPHAILANLEYCRLVNLANLILQSILQNPDEDLPYITCITNHNFIFQTSDYIDYIEA